MAVAATPINVIAILMGIVGFALADELPDEQIVPEEYVVDLREATQFCPPIGSYFGDVTQTVSRVGGRTVRHQANGGFGLPIKDKVGDKHLLHLGADVGWFRVGEPVFAVADGIVRMSEGPALNDEAAKQPRGGGLEWGNVIAIEHRVGKDDYITTVYGHLDSRRLVGLGEMVTAGQQIGTIGKKHRRINGGYDPHLHFGVRKGRKAARGTVFSDVSIEGERTRLRIADVSAATLQLQSSGKLPDRLTIVAGNREFVAIRDGSVLRGPAKALWEFQPLGFRIAGYGLSADAWHDPTAFLGEHKANENLQLLRLGDAGQTEVRRKTTTAP